MTTAVVFAYHNVGVRCLSVLLAHNVEVKLVVTHDDAPGENIWFASVRQFAEARGIPVIAPAEPHEPKAFAKLKAAKPDYLFSFYYRQMLKPAILQLAKDGGYNLHGSLLPKYRGRVPINWAIIHGERETGASLHEMVEKPDAGRLVDQMAVPILPDDTAREVFDKVTVAAEVVLHRSVPPLLAGVAKLKEMDLKKGSYFGGRKPEDGRIAWSKPAVEVHNLVRAVTHPYPGAFTDLPVGRVHIWRTQATLRESEGDPALFTEGNEFLARCGDRRLLRILSADLGGQPLDAASFNTRFGGRAMPVRDAALKVHKPHE
jgi:methionyl-tRNA formyltransferase